MRSNLLLPLLVFSSPTLADLPCYLCPEDEWNRSEIELGLAIVNEMNPWMGSDLPYAEDGVFSMVDLKQQTRSANGEYFSNQLQLESADSSSWLLGAGRQGSWSLDIALDNYQLTSNDQTQTIFSGIGTNELTLPDSWVTGSTTAAMTELPQSLGPVELSMQHQDLLIRLNKQISDQWRVGMSVSERKQDGLRDVGGMIGTNFANARVVILPAFHDSATTDFELSADYNWAGTSLLLSYLASNYDQDADSVSWENPYANQISVPGGEISQAPDNSFHQLSVSGAQRFNADSRLNFSLAYGRYLQDETFAQYSVNNVILFDELPRDSLDGRIDSLIANIRYAQNVSERLSWDVSYRYDDQDNQTDSELYNYIIADTQVTATARSNLPYNYRKQKLRAKLKYRIATDTRLQAGATHTLTERDNQEIEEITSDELWTRIQWNPDPMLDLSLRASQTRQRGSEYGVLNFLQTTPENPLLRKYNLADQDRNRLLLVASRQLGSSTSLGLRLDIADLDYPDSQIGLTSTGESGVYLDLIYAPTDDYSLSLYLGRDDFESEQAGSVAVAEPDWSATINEQALSAGIEFNWYSASRKYQHAIALNIIRADFDINVADSEFPSVESSIDRATYEGSYHASEVLSYSLKLWYESYDEDDWATDAVASDSISNILALGEGNSEQDSIALVAGVGYRF